jgi:hypothetical protein
MILRYHGRFYKVITVRSRGDNNWIFDCRDFDTKKSQTITLNLSGFLEALDKAIPAMKNLKDIFSLDLDNQGRWKVVNEDQLKRLLLKMKQ